tara:strand:- start:4382 stop:4831 length:450 start_codon:yes stop_codon:yes gene_type:complete
MVQLENKIIYVYNIMTSFGKIINKIKKRDEQPKQKSKWRENFDLKKRKSESLRIKNKYPTRIPIICEKNIHSDVPDLDKNKYLVPPDLTVGQFLYVIRKRIKLTPEKSIFLFVDNSIPASSQIISQLYKDHKNEDGFLYIIYSGENTFG